MFGLHFLEFPVICAIASCFNYKVVREYLRIVRLRYSKEEDIEAGAKVSEKATNYRVNRHEKKHEIRKSRSTKMVSLHELKSPIKGFSLLTRDYVYIYTYILL